MLYDDPELTSPTYFFLFYVTVKFDPSKLESENRKLCIFSVAILLCDIKILSISTPMKYRGQGNLVILAKGHSFVVYISFLMKE